MPTDAPDKTASIAEQLLKGDLVNLAKRVKSGAPLTRAQRATLLAYQSGAASDASFAKSWVELGEILGVTRRTLNTWSKREGAPVPAANGGHDVAAWREFVKAHGLKGAEEEDMRAEGSEELKRQRLLVDVQERQLRLAIRRGEYVPIEAVRDRWQFNVEQATMLLRKKLEDEAPPVLEGLGALEIRRELSAIVDSFISVMNAGGETE